MSVPYDPIYRCTECGFTGHADEWHSVCVFWGNAYEPPEHEAYCPGCSTSYEFSEEVFDCEEE